MIVVTTPTGNVGSQLLAELLNAGTEPLRVIVRDPSRLPDAVRDQVQVIVGSHDDPAVLDQALDGAQGLFWLIPPSMRASSAEEYYLSFTRPAAAAIRRHQVGHVVGISSAGWNWPHPAGLLSAAHAMDAELETLRSCLPLARDGVLHGEPAQAATPNDLRGSSVPAAEPGPSAGRRSRPRTSPPPPPASCWTAAGRAPITFPSSADNLTPNEMAATISDVLGSQVTFEQADLEQQTASTIQRGVPEGMARDFTAMYWAQQNGIYDEDWSHATPTPTSFRTWCETVLAPAARDVS